MEYKAFRELMRKRAAAVMTPEAEQAAMQPPMDPAMAGGQPPMDPAMAGGMPPADPAAGGQPSATGPQGGQIPPEILQDQMFVQFLAEMAGIMFDPQSGMFMDPNGQPVPAEMIMQAYEQFQAQMQQQQAGAPAADPAMAGGQPPMDPAMAGGMPPADPAMAATPMPPEAGMPPADMGAAPMEGAMPSETGMEPPPAVPDEVMDQIVSAVMSGVETMLQQYTEKMEAKFSELSDKLEALVDVAKGTDDTRTKDDRDQITKLRQEMEADLTPVKQASVQAPKKTRKLANIFDIIQG